MGGSLIIYLFRWIEKKSRQDCNFFYVNFFRCHLFKGQNHEFLSHIFQQCLHFVPGRISSRPKTSVLPGLKRKQFSPLYLTIYPSPFRCDCTNFYKKMNERISLSDLAQVKSTEKSYCCR